MDPGPLLGRGADQAQDGAGTQPRAGATVSCRPGKNEGMRSAVGPHALALRRGGGRDRSVAVAVVVHVAGWRGCGLAGRMAGAGGVRLFLCLQAGEVFLVSRRGVGARGTGAADGGHVVFGLPARIRRQWNRRDPQVNSSSGHRPYNLRPDGGSRADFVTGPIHRVS